MAVGFLPSQSTTHFVSLFIGGYPLIPEHSGSMVKSFADRFIAQAGVLDPHVGHVCHMNTYTIIDPSQRPNHIPKAGHLARADQMEPFINQVLVLAATSTAG
jgi:hypothetical protein